MKKSITLTEIIKPTLILLASLIIISCHPQSPDALTPADYVNPFIGTSRSNEGHTHPGAQSPWGMISVSPQNVDSQDGGYHATGYLAEETFLYGFAHTNLSGVGCPDMGSLLLLPVAGECDIQLIDKGIPFAEQRAEAGYYAATVGEKEHAVRGEVATTKRSAIERYRYPEGATRTILLNLGRSISLNKGAEVRILNGSVIEGWKRDGAFGRPTISHKTYFRIEFDASASDIQIYNNGKPLAEAATTASGDSLAVRFRFDADDAPLLVKSAISYVSCENAHQNMTAEIPAWDFDAIRTQAHNEWNEVLERIEVSRESKEQCEIFYTALYHALIHPNIISDCNGEYPMMGQDGKVGRNSEYARFSVFSLWDTYRNVHPLLTLVYPEIQSQMLSSMVDMYRESGWLPKWEIISNESFVMVGDPALPVIADSYLKGIVDFDYEHAYEAMKKHAFQIDNNLMRPGMKPYIENGYIPHDDNGGDFVWGSLSTSLEYYLADWTMAQMAKALGDNECYDTLIERSKGYKKYWDGDHLLLRPRMKNGAFAEPFDEFAREGWRADGGNGYVEGTAWQYTWFVPYDIEGLVELFGSPEKFIERLQLCFDKEYFTLANEPDMGYPFIFNYFEGEEWRTQVQVANCLAQNFDTTTSGLPGNDDTGTTSTWALFAMMGFYPDCIASPAYTLFAPAFEHVTIHTNDRYYSGNDIEICRKGDITPASPLELTVNGEVKSHYFIDHAELVDGAKIEYQQ